MHCDSLDSDPFWRAFRSGLERLSLLFLSLLVVLAIACSDGQREERETPLVYSPTSTPLTGENRNGTGISPTGDEPQLGRGKITEVIFPRHDAPLGTDNGGNYYAGRLLLAEGCLRVEVPPDTNGPGVSRLPIWPNGFALSIELGVIRVVDRNGRIAAHVGDHIRLSSSTASYQEARDKDLVRGMPESCAGPYFLVGDEVTAFVPDHEPTEMRLSDPEVHFPRKKTVEGRLTHKTADAVGVLELDGQCLRLKRSSDAPYTTVIWPPGFTSHAHRGVIQVRNGAGRIIAQVGDRIAGGGSYGDSAYEGCPGDTFAINSIEVLPDVKVYFPRQDGSLATDKGMERFVGNLVLDKECLRVDSVIRDRDHASLPKERPLLIWPDSFTLNLDDDVVELVDENGRVIARAGDDVQFGAISLSYLQAVDHGGIEAITPACSGPYWVVGDDIAAVPDSESP